MTAFLIVLCFMVFGALCLRAAERGSWWGPSRPSNRDSHSDGSE